MMRKIIHTELIITKTKTSDVIERLCTVDLISLFYRLCWTISLMLVTSLIFLWAEGFLPRYGKWY